MARRWTPALFKMLDARTTSHVDGHKRTIQAALDRGWVEPRRGWTEAPASRYHRRARATESVWTVIGYRITDAGAVALADERCRRKVLDQTR